MSQGSISFQRPFYCAINKGDCTVVVCVCVRLCMRMQACIFLQWVDGCAFIPHMSGGVCSMCCKGITALHLPVEPPVITAVTCHHWSAIIWLIAHRTVVHQRDISGLRNRQLQGMLHLYHWGGWRQQHCITINPTLPQHTSHTMHTRLLGGD